MLIKSIVLCIFFVFSVYYSAVAVLPETWLGIAIDSVARRPCNEGMSIVIGSHRNPLPLIGYCPQAYDPLPGAGDFFHEKTFGGGAYTLDALACNHPRHFQEDVLGFTPDRKKTKLAAVLMEFFPTRFDSPRGESMERTEEEVYFAKFGKVRPERSIASVIMLMAEGMLPGAPLIVEVSPAISIGTDLLLIDKDIKENPFHCIVCESDVLQLGIDQPKFARIDPVILEQAIQGVEKLFSGKNVRKLIKEESDRLRKPSYFKKNFGTSFTIFLLSEYTMYAQHSLMKSFLEKNGLTDVVFKRVKVSPYNGRRNIWTIEATRAGDLLLH